MMVRMNFEDHFSKWAEDYARNRPRYPDELFSYLASISPGRKLAWDCGTGNGQAAIKLVDHFERVIATDASSDQLARAIQHERIEYRIEPAEEVTLSAGSIDLITVAIAVHWFDLDRFYQQVRRVLKPEGILAVWSYHLPVIQPGIDNILNRFYTSVLSGYWPERFHYVDERYQTLPFPFDELLSPPYEMIAEWDMGQMVGFINTWSATRRYQEKNGFHPLKFVWDDLLKAWGDPEHKWTIHWPIYLRVARILIRSSSHNLSFRA